MQGYHWRGTAGLQPADLLFWGSSAAKIHHVGIYIGNNQYIHAPATGDVVKIQTLSTHGDYYGFARYF